MLKRVVVTGVGVVAAGLVGGGQTLTRWLAQVPSPPSDHAVDDTLLAALMDGVDARRASRVSRFTVAATRLSLADAGLDDAGAAGFVLGTEHGDLHSAIEFAEGFLRGGPSGVSALAFPNTVMNTMASAATIACAAHGPALTLNVRTVGGELAVARAAHTIASGRLDVALAGGVDVRNPTVDATLAELGDAEMRGEGATVLVLESLDHARARGASPCGEILGAAWRGLPARPNGVGHRAESRAIAAALAEAGLAGQAITWAYSSSSGDGPRDAWERALLVRALGSEITVASLARRFGQHAGLGALRVAAAAWSAGSGRLIDPPVDVAPGPGLVHGIARGGTHVALVVGPAPDGVAR
ncbi:MAG TPA: beta-ketoacyl synthase N-terminal-like domain-containing protein [Candidatus Acidoferrum sp.]|nr:beta-ketoacyl synthase N-terminal-like domain-containing protein [Candidatus Acidoferrum sp.]